MTHKMKVFRVPLKPFYISMHPPKRKQAVLQLIGEGESGRQAVVDHDAQYPLFQVGLEEHGLV